MKNIHKLYTIMFNLMMLFQPELGWGVLDRWVGSLTLDVGLLCKTRNKKGSAEARLLPLRCLSQFFPVGEKIICLGNGVLRVSQCTFRLWGGLVFIMDDHDNFPNWIMILNSMFPSWMMTLNSMFHSWRMIQYFSH